MKIFTEKEAESFLYKCGFEVAQGVFAKEISDIDCVDFRFPVVAKASGKKIIHKKKLNGVVIGINNFENLKKYFLKLKKIQGCEEVLVQEQLIGNEIFFGIKKTPEFMHVVIFGKGGSNVEKDEDVSFRVCPVKNKDVVEMINEVNFSKNLSKKEKLFCVKILKKLCKLVKKYSDISELDINPMINGKIVDARMVFES